MVFKKLRKQNQELKEDIDCRDYVIKEQNQRIDRKQDSLLKILNECKNKSYKNLEEFRAKIKELATTGIRY